MKFLYSLIFTSLVAFNVVYSQCGCTSACTITINGNNSSNIGNINPGTTVCVTATGNFTGTMGDITAGEICVAAGGVFAPTNIGNFNGGTINNEGTMDLSAKANLNLASNVNNCGEFIGSNISLSGGITFSNYATVSTSGNFFVTGGATLNMTGGLITVANDFNNSGTINGSGCGIINVSGFSANTSNITGEIDVCDNGMPPAGLDNQNGTIGPNVTFCVCVPLPIELLEFSATEMTDKVKLNWITASEFNNDYFTIERSQDGNEWFEIALTDGAGNSSTTLNYEELDNSPLLDISYYRLKQVDFDGNFEYSHIESVNFEGIEIINAYPNPSIGNMEVIVNTSLDITAQIELYNLMGDKVVYKEKDFKRGFNTLKLDLGKIATGTYYLIIKTSDNKFFSKKQLEFK